MLLAMSLRLECYELTPFVQKQKLQQYSGETAKVWRAFYKIVPDLKVYMWAQLSIMLAVSVALLTYLTSPIIGLLYALLLVFALKVVARIPLLQRFTHRLFEAKLSVVVSFIKPLHSFWSLLGSHSQVVALEFGSKEEFVDHLQRLPSTVLDPWQRQRLETTLAAEEKTAKQIMTSKKRATVIAPTATLGPILLSDLQKTGHAYFPVLTKNGDPEGVLRLSDLTDIQQAKQHHKASDLMTTHIAWANEDTQLFDLVQIFLQEKQYLLFIRNLEGDYSGIVTVADIAKHTLGIVQE